MQSESGRPNILFIYTDDQSTRSVSCYPEAHPWVRTPNIDRIGNEGVRFSYFYGGAWCMSSRAIALTGRLPYGIQSLRIDGDVPNSTYDPEECPFWPSVFRKHGYFTAIIGKWHTGADHGHGRDWDYSIVWNHTKPAQSGPYYINQKLSFQGKPPRAVEGYSTDNYTRWAIDLIRQRATVSEVPWFLWLCYDAPHKPYRPADRHRTRVVGPARGGIHVQRPRRFVWQAS